MKRMFVTAVLALAMASPAVGHGWVGHFGELRGHPNPRFLAHRMQTETRGGRVHHQWRGGEAVYWLGGEYEGYEPEHPPLDPEPCSSDRSWCQPPKAPRAPQWR